MKKKNRSSKNKTETIKGLLFLTPNILGFLVFIVIPIFFGIYISFTNYNGFNKMDFVNFDNYIKLFKDTFFITAFKNNIFYTVTSVPLTIIASLLLAIALNRALKFGGFFKTVYFFPSITSMVAIGIVWSMIFNPTKGPINMLLSSLGVDDLPKWLSSSKTALFTIVLIVVWKNAGYYMVMFLAGLKSIPKELYEAADIDGANGIRKFWSITMPMLSPTTFMVTILCIISSFQVFDIINITTKGGPGQSTKVIAYRIYEESIKNLRFGYGAAMSFALFLIIFIVTLIQFRGQKKWVNY